MNANQKRRLVRSVRQLARVTEELQKELETAHFLSVERAAIDVVAVGLSYIKKGMDHLKLK